MQVQRGSVLGWAIVVEDRNNNSGRDGRGYHAALMELSAFSCGMGMNDKIVTKITRFWDEYK